MASTIKVDTIDTPSGSGNITVSRPLSGSGASLTSLPAGNLTGAMASGVTGVGKIVQVVNVMDSGSATTTNTIPFDNSIPQNTEGAEFLTLAITPTSATNKLRIDVVMTWSCQASTLPCVALFQDSTAGAIAAVYSETDTVNHGECTSFTHYMTSGTTSSTTFKVRMGPHTATQMTYNGQNGGRTYGGVMASSITITEIAV